MFGCRKYVKDSSPAEVKIISQTILFATRLRRNKYTSQPAEERLNKKMDKMHKNKDYDYILTSAY